MENITKYLSFIGIVLFFALPLEYLTTFTVPGKYFSWGTPFFYVIFGSIGALVYFKKISNVKKIGAAGLIFGFALELTVLKPVWVNPNAIIKWEQPTAIVITAFFWFFAWALPAFVLNRFRPAKK
ncbi:MAG: hypothetical protein AB1305_05945 [Candidatus Hadarchaeota archaeon]